MKAVLRQKLLEAVASGLDLEAAAAQAGVPLKVVQGDARLMSEIADNYRLGSAKLRARLLSIALEDGDARTLASLLEQREEATRRLFGAPETPEQKSRLDAMRDELRREVERNAVAHEAAMRARVMAELRAEGRLVAEAEVLPPEPRTRTPSHPLVYEALHDEGVPLPSDRALVPTSPPGASVGRPKVWLETSLAGISRSASDTQYSGRILPQTIVERHHAQPVKQLPLVLVDALDLAVEDRVWIEGDSGG